MRLIGRIVGILLGLAIAIVVGVVYFVQDANRLKPELETLLTKQSGYQATINGDIAWQLFPPLHLTVDDLTLSDDEQRIETEHLDLKLDLSAIWQDTTQWRITELHVTGSDIISDDSTLRVNKLDLMDFAFNESAPIFADLLYQANDAEAPTPVKLKGAINYSPADESADEVSADRITLSATTITLENAQGVCDLVASRTPFEADDSVEAPADELLPLDLLASYDLTAQCAMAHLMLNEETFTGGTLDINNAAGTLDVMLTQPDFFGGELRTETVVKTNRTPAQWSVIPNMANVDSQRLMDWSEQSLQWIAAIAMHSEIAMSGNTEEELLNSMQAKTEFDGGQGQLNVAKIKEQLLRIALLTSKADEVEQWPDMWDYEQFIGTWKINGQHHDLDFALDHMSVTASGKYDILADQIDMLANVTMYEAPEGSPYKVNPILQDTPIPLTCRGTAEDPKCRVDDDAVKTLIANAFRSDSDSGLRRKIEEKIDDEVPEEYRETARSILDILGRALE